MIHFALYFIPPEESSLYRFGSRVVGYDIRRDLETMSPWRTQVGPAEDYGFHLTVADDLCFVDEAEIEHIEAEVERILRRFPPFELTDLVVRGGFPDVDTVSLALVDPSQGLAALHTEMVHRVYRRSVASGFTLASEDLRPGTDPDRATFLIGRYHAPYVLDQFVPHFTLLSAASTADLDATEQDLAGVFAAEVPRPSIEVQRLALMQRPNGRWRIKREIELAG
jgi:2'-5' RNA ligase